MVDLGLKSVAPLPGKSRCLRVTINMNNPRDDGLSSSEESGTLNSIQDEIDDRLGEEVINAGRVNAAGKFRIYFYFGEPEGIQEKVAEVMLRFPNYKYELKITNENDWTSYFDFLYPLPVQMKIIQNENVLRVMATHGDDPGEPRKVDHAFYFATEIDMEKFLEAIEGEGFTIDGRELIEGDGRFQLLTSRVDKLDIESLNEYTLYLWELAGQLGGEYDGWGAVVVKSDDSKLIN
jgi:uncharacterized protein (TIGR01619 family)